MATIRTYSFTTQDLTAPVLSNLLWISPRQLRLEFSEALQGNGEPGSPAFRRTCVGNMEFLHPNQILAPGLAPAASWIGYYAHPFGSYHSRNNIARRITAVGAGGLLTLDTSEAGEISPDDGLDTGDLHQVLRRRTLGVVVSSFRIMARLASEGIGLERTNAEVVQCAYEPPVAACTTPIAEDIAADDNPARYVVLTFADDVSINRLYRIDMRQIADVYGNVRTSASLNTAAPSFGAPADRFQIWDFLLPAVRDEDMESQQLLRRMCVVLQDLLNVLWNRVDGLQYIYDPWRLPASMLPFLLHHLGNPFEFPLSSIRMQRRLIERLLEFYQQVGTVCGMEKMLTFFMGRPCEVVPYWPYRGWRLGTSTLGVDTYLAPGSAYLVNSYEVIVHNTTLLPAVTVEERNQIIQICDWADTVDQHLARIVEVSP